jgi:xanthine dehydrogenase YagR molybdenum-binding subunit
MKDEKAKASLDPIKMPMGIVGGKMEEVERIIPAGEPPPLPVNEKLSSIGKRTTRLDGRLKVTGGARYTADIRLPGMLYAQVVTSPHPHARVISIDTSEAEKLAGVKAFHILDRVDGNAVLRDKSKEIQSNYPIVRYAGQPVAAVAAVSQAVANEAAKLIKIVYEPLPFVVEVDKAKQPGAPLVFPGAADQEETAGGGGGPGGVSQTGNVRGPMGRPRGKVEEGFKEANVVVEGTFRTQVQTHSALETHGVVVDWKPEMLTVYASTQGTTSVRDELAAIFNLKKSQVRVITEFMGGGFGAKFGAGNVGVIATHLSKKANAPVYLMLDRKDEHLSGGNRPSSVQSLKIGAKKDGKLTAVEFKAYGTAGTGTGAGSAGPSQNMYVCANVSAQESDVFINAGPGAAFRAPGHPQGCFSLEQMIDALAEKLSMDPLALRDLNDASEARRIERKIGAEKIGWSTRHKAGADTGPIKRGLGVAQGVWYRFVNRDSNCEVRITRDGSVELMSAVQDIGGGIRTALAQVVAEELGLKPQDITIRIGDTNFPAGPASGGSVTTNSITPSARNAAFKVKQQLLEQVAESLGTTPDKLVMKNGKVHVYGPLPIVKEGEVAYVAPEERILTFKQATSRLKTEQISAIANRADEYKNVSSGGGQGRVGIMYGGVQFVEVAVDTETGVIKVERVVAVQDCGRPINPLALESQINGGILQGISYALYENRILDRNTGLMVNANLEQYKILGAKETPKIEAYLIEEYYGRSSTDAGGIGEPATIPTAAAIANAFYNATGKRIYEMPMTPARVLKALKG